MHGSCRPAVHCTEKNILEVVLTPPHHLMNMHSRRLSPRPPELVELLRLRTSSQLWARLPHGFCVDSVRASELEEKKLVGDNNKKNLTSIGPNGGSAFIYDSGDLRSVEPSGGFSFSSRACLSQSGTLVPSSGHTTEFVRVAAAPEEA